jgi:hypothetical protein
LWWQIFDTGEACLFPANQAGAKMMNLDGWLVTLNESMSSVSNLASADPAIAFKLFTPFSNARRVNDTSQYFFVKFKGFPGYIRISQKTAFAPK